MLCFRNMIVNSLNRYPVRSFSSFMNKASRKTPNPLYHSRSYGVEPIPDLRLANRKKNIGPSAIFMLSIPVATFALGTWQVKRRKWKEDLIQNLMVKTHLPAVDLPVDDEEVKNLEFRKVKVKGEFDHSGEFFLGPRSCLIHGESKTNEGKLLSKSANGVSGYLVVTPFVLSGSGERILVNRGWIPFTQKSGPAVAARARHTGEVELEGIVRNTEPKPQFTPLNKLDARVWFSRDVNGMAQFSNTRPVFIDASFESTVPGGPIGGQTRASLRNEHFSYILTWYSLSAATAFMWYRRYIK